MSETSLFLLNIMKFLRSDIPLNQAALGELKVTS